MIGEGFKNRQENGIKDHIFDSQGICKLDQILLYRIDLSNHIINNLIVNQISKTVQQNLNTINFQIITVFKTKIVVAFGFVSKENFWVFQSHLRIHLFLTTGQTRKGNLNFKKICVCRNVDRHRMNDLSTIICMSVCLFVLVDAL